jgi:hypothetical protein
VGRRFVVALAMIVASCGLVTGLDSLDERTSVANGVKDGSHDGVSSSPPPPPPDDDGSTPPLGDGGVDVINRPDVDVPDGKALLFVVVSGPPVSRVTSSPIQIDCTSAGGTPCWALFDSGAPVYLIADGGTASFVEWGGACTASLEPGCQLYMKSNLDVSARFQ